MKIENTILFKLKNLSRFHPRNKEFMFNLCFFRLIKGSPKNSLILSFWVKRRTRKSYYISKLWILHFASLHSE